MHNLRVLYVEVGFCGAESKLATSDNQADSGSQRNKQNGKNLLPIQEVLASDAVIDDDNAGMISEDKNTVIEMPD